MAETDNASLTERQQYWLKHSKRLTNDGVALYTPRCFGSIFPGSRASISSTDAALGR